MMVHVIISIHSSTSRCYVDLLNCDGSRNTNIQCNNFHEYLPITVILLMSCMLSENSLLLSVMVLLEILSEVPRLHHFLTKDWCADQANTSKTIFIETGIHFEVIKPVFF